MKQQKHISKILTCTSCQIHTNNVLVTGQWPLGWNVQDLNRYLVVENEIEVVCRGYVLCCPHMQVNPILVTTEIDGEINEEIHKARIYKIIEKLEQSGWTTERVTCLALNHPYRLVSEIYYNALPNV